MRIPLVCRVKRQSHPTYWNHPKYSRSNAVKSEIVKVLLIILSVNNYWKNKNFEATISEQIFWWQGQDGDVTKQIRRLKLQLWQGLACTVGCTKMHESLNFMGADSQNRLLYQTKSLQKDLGFFLQNCGGAQFLKFWAFLEGKTAPKRL